MKEQAQNRHKTWANEVHWWCLDFVPNRKSAEEKLYFHTKMNFGVGISSFQLKIKLIHCESTVRCKIHILMVVKFRKFTLFFFHLLAVRPAQTHPGPYGPGCVVLLIEVDSTTPGGTTWSCGASQTTVVMHCFSTTFGCGEVHFFLFCISGRKAWNAYTSQAVRPEMCKLQLRAYALSCNKSISQPSVVRCVYFSFDQLFFLKRKVGINWSSP